MDSAEAIIAKLGLAPHPEGGYFRETFRDVPGPDGRARSTAIYFLLPEGVTSAWHRVDAVETWHFYAGAPLELAVSEDGKRIDTHHLGPDLARGEIPQVVLPEMAWQSATSTGAWTLVGCTVAPGFEFSGFEMAKDGWSPG
ncbi:cupin domain-containing protein [Hyphobacterium marinum]|uniref:Cupin domain-containing protein n=1 Tax=Hyphobacterium marinum TaxID=3116574 RepID=A0ABU7LYI7_9PROT|nr:cupin domain-containing protein [Hyphobacterium sp. Y6023]MEE2566342.1 cupin domain-containing protein [Hyphobacterium sp. Y6023]